MKHLVLDQITQHVYWLSPDESTDRPILGAISGKHGTLIVDAGNSPSHAKLFLEKLSKVNIAGPKYLALTHWHWDHVFGASTINLPTFAHTETKRIVAEMAQLDWSDEALDRRVEEKIEIEFCRDMIKTELPDRADLKIRSPEIAFMNQIELDLGGITCLLAHVGGDHSSDSVIVFAQEDKIIFLGDCLYENIYDHAPSYTPHKLFSLIEQLLNYEAEYFILAHEPEPMTKMKMIEYTSSLYDKLC